MSEMEQTGRKPGLQEELDTAVAHICSELEDGDVDFALRLTFDIFTLMRARAAESDASVLQLPQSTGDEHFDTLLQAGIRWALAAGGCSAIPWPAPTPLRQAWYPFGFRSADWQRITDAETPDQLRAANIRIRERSLLSA